MVMFIKPADRIRIRIGRWEPKDGTMAIEHSTTLWYSKHGNGIWMDKLTNPIYRYLKNVQRVCWWYLTSNISMANSHLYIHIHITVYIIFIWFSQLYTSIFSRDFPASHVWWHRRVMVLIHLMFECLLVISYFIPLYPHFSVCFATTSARTRVLAPEFQ